MAEVYSLADKMADELTLYTTVQGITMQMLILRFIKVLSAQKRLSILTTTAVKVCCSPVFTNLPLPCSFLVLLFW